MNERFCDHYAVLEVANNATADVIRRAFRARLLEVHPDKSGDPDDPERLTRVMRAFEVLSQPETRQDYDRALTVRRRFEDGDHESRIPHVTESGKPASKARAILYLLLNEDSDEAFTRLHMLDEDPALFLASQLEHGEFVDAAFLLAEALESRKQNTEALFWYQEIIRKEQHARYPRPCYPEMLERAKRLLIQKLHDASVEPHAGLEYLRRAESLGLQKHEQFEVHKKRSQYYLALEMRVEAARQLRCALQLQPHAKGLGRLREQLSSYLDE